MKSSKSYTLGILAEALDADLEGDKNIAITGLATLEKARPGDLSFLSNPAYFGLLADTEATAVILEPRFSGSFQSNKLVTENPYLAFAKASQLFDNAPTPGVSIHPTAYIDDSAEIGDEVTIGPHTVIEGEVRIGQGSIIGAGVFIGQGSKLGTNCTLHSNVTIYHGVKLGNNVHVHSASVLGADGFGFAFDGEKSVKIAQLGSLTIGDDVDIGAGTTIDRGALSDTVIEQGVKIDNQVQIGHNCRVGKHTVICGCTAIAGSVTIGKYCVLGGATGVVGHIEIADHARISAMSLVSKSIKKKGSYSSGTGIMESRKWKKNIVRFRELDEINRAVKRLEKKLPGNDD